jgi:hypothetical protein
MKCIYCNEEISKTDPCYGKFDMHANCIIQLQTEMEKSGLIRVSDSCRMQYSLTRRFEKFLNRTMNHTRMHISHDETVDEDIVDLQGVLRAINDFCKGVVPDKKILLFSEIIFNGLMVEKYGSSLSNEKLFSSRIRELIEEVYSFETSEEEQKLFRHLLPRNTPIASSNASKSPHRMINASDLNKELEEQLEKASQEILDLINKMAIEIEALGASRQWRNFRKDELVLQTVQDIIMTHLQTSPIPEVVIEETDKQIYDNSINSLLADVMELSSMIAKKHNVPVGVVFARILSNVMMNLVRGYSEALKSHANKP